MRLHLPSLIASSVILLCPAQGHALGFRGHAYHAASCCTGVPYYPYPHVAQPSPRPDFTPVVAIEVLAPDRIALGQEATYRIRLTNRSRHDAHHVTVRDTLPAHAKFVRAEPEPTRSGDELEWRFGTLQGGQHRDITLVLLPTGKGDIDNCVRVTFEHGQCVTTRVSRAGLSLIKRGPAKARKGDTVAFELIAGNPSDVPLANVILQDKLPEGLEHIDGGRDLTWVLGTLAPGQSRTITYRVVIRAAGKQCNRAVVTAAGGLREEAEHCIEVAEARLKLAVTGPAKHYLNGLATYQLTVTNAGDTRVDDGLLTYYLPDKTAYAGGSEGARPTPGQVQWLLPPLEPNASRSVEVQIRPQALGLLEHRALVEGGGAKVEALYKTEIIGAAGLLIEVVDEDDPILVGQETFYRIIVRNQGTLPVTNVRVLVTVPKQLQVVKVQASVNHKSDAQKLLFDTQDIPAKKDIEYRIVVKAADSGSVRIRVEMSADPLTAGPVLEEESTSIVRE
jgi:uncharacterized repeat protein (TIGR01451 family)